jgi:EmrB/QacA subfamily drug resistance transporter
MLRSLEAKWFVAIAFVFGLFMEILDMTVLNTALPAIGREFGVDTGALQYPITAYLVSLAVFIPASGWVGDRFGTKRTFAVALAIFTGASALAGAANSMEMLILARVLQGVGGGMMTPVGTTMLFRAFPVEERAKASSVLAIPTMIAPAMGPVLGGWLTDNYSWRWIFYLNLPIGLVGLLFTIFFVPEQPTGKVGRFDLPGFLLGGAGLASLLVGLERIASHGFGDALTQAAVGFGAVLLSLFILVELRVKEPLLDLRLLRNKYYRAGNISVFVSTGALMGVLFLFPLMLQQVRGLDATHSGLTTIAQVLGMFMIMPFGGRLYPVLGPRYMMAMGFAVISVTIGSMLFVDYDASLWVFRGQLFLMGIGMALTMIPSQAATFEDISGPDTANASALVSTTRQIASAAGVALMSTMLTSRLDIQLANISDAAGDAFKHAAFNGYQDTFMVSLAFAVIGIAFAFVFRKTVGYKIIDDGGDGSGTPAPAVEQVMAH